MQLNITETYINDDGDVINSEQVHVCYTQAYQFHRAAQSVSAKSQSIGCKHLFTKMKFQQVTIKGFCTVNWISFLSGQGDQ